MTQSLETLSRQMGSMESIHSVVHTMKTLSVINSAPYEQSARAIDAYHDTVLDGLHAFVAAVGPLERTPEKIGRRSVIAFGSDHGLCGNYNEVIATRVSTHLAASPADETRLLCVGAQMANALADRGQVVEHVFLPPASVDGLGRVATQIARHIDTSQQSDGLHASAVDLAFVARGDQHMHHPRIIALLPFDRDLLHRLRTSRWESRSLPSFAMPRDDLLSALLQAHVFASLVKAAAEAMVTENAARLALMQQAEQSVKDRLEALKSDANALRQSGITTELLDVIIGFEALNGRRASSSGTPSRQP